MLLQRYENKYNTHTFYSELNDGKFSLGSTLLWIDQNLLGDSANFYSSRQHRAQII